MELDKEPVREGYTFTGWYADKALTEPIDDIRMTSNKTVYAGWEKTGVPDRLNGDDHFAYIIGRDDGLVHPEATITRAEVATIFFRLLDEDVRDSLVQQTEEKIQDTGVSLVMAVVESLLAQSILYAALFLVSFVGLTILLKLLIRAMDLVLRAAGAAPGHVLGGAVIGLIEGALVLFLAIWVLRRFGVSFETDTVSATHILRFFATHTPLSALSFLQ